MAGILLRESIDIEPLIEEIKGVKTYFLYGPAIKMNFENKNKRTYESSMVIPEVERYNKEKIALDDAWGELDHPDTVGMNLSKMVCAFKEPLIIEGDDVILKAKILNNIWGTIVTTAIDENIRLGYSSRGNGNIVYNSGKNWVKDWTLITPADIVSNPSIGEFPEIQKEDIKRLENIIVEMTMHRDPRLEMIYESELGDSIRKAISESSKSNLDKVLHEQFTRIINM